MNPPTFDQALATARQLSLSDRARLIAKLAEDLAAPLATPAEASVRGPDAWERLNQLREEFRTLYPDARRGARLDTDRQERDASLMGRAGLDDVHT